MANNSFSPTDSDIDADDEPMTPSVFKARFDAHDPLLWWYLAPGYGYDPYLVRFESQSGSQVTFKFIDCATGAVFGSGHQISLDDHKLVHGEAPSSVPNASDYAAGRTIGFLMLNPNELARAGLQTDAENANTDMMTASGKWPGTAAEPRKYVLMLRRNAKLQNDNAELQLQLDSLQETVRQVLEDEKLSKAHRTMLQTMVKQ